MRTGRPIPPLTLTEDERDTLERWARRPTTARALAERARLVLECAAGKTNTVVARELRLTKQTIGKWRTRFLGQRLDGLLDEPRPGAPRRITDDEVERVMRVTLETTPRDATHWSTRTLARRCGLSQTAVSRIWRAFSLRPHRVKTFKLSKDPLFIDKVRDIVGLYLNPPDKALVLCVDEKAQIQALDRTQPLETAYRRYIGVPNQPTGPLLWTHTPMESSRASPAFVIESLTRGPRLPPVVFNRGAQCRRSGAFCSLRPWARRSPVRGRPQ